MVTGDRVLNRMADAVALDLRSPEDLLRPAKVETIDPNSRRRAKYRRHATNAQMVGAGIGVALFTILLYVVVR